MNVTRKAAPFLGKRLPGLMGLATLATFGLAVLPAAAQDAYFTSDATINYAINGNAYVGKAAGENGPNPANVNLVDGGSVSSGVYVYFDSMLNFRGGSAGSLSTDDNGVANISGGSAGSLFTDDDSMANVNGGTIAGVFATGQSTVNIGGGSVGSVTAQANGAVNISGGRFGYDNVIGTPVEFDGGGTINISGGKFSNTGNYNSSVMVTTGTANISGGTFDGSLFAGGANVSSENLTAGTLNVNGGSVAGYLEADEDSNVTVGGGTFGTEIVGNINSGDNFVDGTQGAFTLVGEGLSATFIHLDPFDDDGSDYMLQGAWQNGQSATGDVIDVSYSAKMFTIAAAGSSQSMPILPNSTNISNGTTTFAFVGVPTDSWVDPKSATAFVFNMTDGSLFTGIGGFPTGFTSPFDVTADGKDYGLFSPGQILTFDGDGVSSFIISGIDPMVDGNSPTAFPLQLTFNTATADFTMAAAPEPSQFAGLGMGVLGLARLILRARKSRTVA